MNRVIKTKINKCVSMFKKNIIEGRHELLREIYEFSTDNIECDSYIGGLIVREFDSRVNNKRAWIETKESPIGQFTKCLKGLDPESITSRIKMMREEKNETTN